jgi:NAD(P)H-hydrate epimerase
MNAREPDHFRVQGPVPTRDARPAPAMYELSVENARELDRRAVEEYAMDSIVLMENAAIGLCTHALDMLRDVADPSVVICAGPGNNGGDGFALARHLHNHQIPTRVVRTIDADAYSGDAGKNLRIIERMGIETMGLDAFLGTQPHPSVSLIVDALFGTGLGRAIEGRVGKLVSWINTARSSAGTRVLAVDTPSGLDAQTGLSLGSLVVRADRTVTFAGLKPGMARMEAIEFLGEVHVAPIGVPIELLDELGHRIESKNAR